MEVRKSARLAEKKSGLLKATVETTKRRKIITGKKQADNPAQAPPAKRKKPSAAATVDPPPAKPRKPKADPASKRPSAKKNAIVELEETHLTVVTTKCKRLERLPSRDLEMELWSTGYRQVIGVDEAGRGPLAGPVVAAACIIPANIFIEGMHDSKKLTAEKREHLYSQIISSPGVLFSVCVVDAARIDEINILQATMQAMRECVSKLTEDGSQQYVLIDGNRIPNGLPVEYTRSVIKGDSECHIIAAASILAKVTRDRLMEEYDRKWPVYGFKDHKGYGTASHTAALLKHGPCEIHRRSFAPLKHQINS